MFLAYFFVSFFFLVVKYLNFYVNNSCNKKNIRNYLLFTINNKNIHVTF